MWRKYVVGARQWRAFHAVACRQTRKPVIQIKDATFYKHYPSGKENDSINPALFQGLNFDLPNQARDHDSVDSSQRQCWAVISNASIARTTFLQILAGQHICLPPNARTYPHLSDIQASPQHTIQYVGFDAERGTAVGGTSVRGAYLSARYESRREETDYSVRDYLTGHTELNALERKETLSELHNLDEIVQQLNLRNLLQMPVANLSNGQTRRARVAKALMSRPEVLLLDGPFMGIDPNTLTSLSGVLRDLTSKSQLRLIVSLRPEDYIPDWITHLVVVNDHLQVVGQGLRDSILGPERSLAVQEALGFTEEKANVRLPALVSLDGFPKSSPGPPKGEAVVQMQGVKVSYGTKTVLGDWEQNVGSERTSGLWWSLHRGQRCGIFGPNGSGKTTMLSLITSDHPQTYSLPIKLFGRSRLPGPGEQGISLFDIQRRMGHSSPEVHAFFPKQLTVRRALESAWADAPMAKPRRTEESARKVDACLRWFANEITGTSGAKPKIEKLELKGSLTPELLQKELSDDEDIAWAKDKLFGELNFTSQRLILFLRSVVASPDLIILDEAFSGMDEAVRNKALLFLSQGENVRSVEHGVAIPSILAKHGATAMDGLSPGQALLVISHSKEDVPGCVREWICLPEPGEARQPRVGRLDGPLQLNPSGWSEIWGG